MSKYTFGIYVTHMFFIENLNSIFNLHSLSFFPVVSVPVISMLVFICALVVYPSNFKSYSNHKEILCVRKEYLKIEPTVLVQFF